jgi:hypothetical protein
MKTGADFQAASRRDRESVRVRASASDARQNFQQRALAGAVQADDADNFTAVDFERDILQRPDVRAVLQNCFETAKSGESCVEIASRSVL